MDFCSSNNRLKTKAQHGWRALQAFLNAEDAFEDDKPQKHPVSVNGL